MRLVFFLAFLGIVLGQKGSANDGNAEHPCSFPISDYWSQVEHTPWWDEISEVHPQIAKWRPFITRSFAVWSKEPGVGYVSSLRKNRHQFTLIIPTSGKRPMQLRIESRSYPKIWGTNGETHLINLPFAEFIETYRRAVAKTLETEKISVSSVQSSVRHHPVGDTEFRLLAVIEAPVTSAHLHLFSLVIEEVRPIELVP